MKKKFTLLLAAFMLLMVSAQAQSPLTFQWAHSVDGNTTAGDNVIGMAKSSDGNYYVATSFGSSSSQTNAMGVWIDGVESDEIEGSPYTGTSQNNNLVLQKVDSNGNVQWMIYTDKGDVDCTASHVAPTSDGGVVLAIKARAWVEEAGLDVLLRFVLPVGRPQTVKDSETKNGEYRYVIAKISSSGLVEWTKTVSGTVKTYAKYETKNNAYVNGMAIDSNDNIYIAGNYRTELNFASDDGTKTTLVASNPLYWNGTKAEMWNGDSQSVVGDLFLVKLDNHGNFVKSLLAEGTAKCAFLDNVVCVGDKLYLKGRVQGYGSLMSIGGKTLQANTECQMPLILSVENIDLSVNYLRELSPVKNSANKFVIQNKGAQYLNGSLYFTGLLNGGLRNADGITDIANNNSTLLKGYVLQVDPNTGNVLHSVVRTSGGINGYFGVFEGKNNLYAFGYDMSAGAILTVIDYDAFSIKSEDVICRYGTVANATTPLVDGDHFIMAHRGGKAREVSNVASFYGTEFTLTNLKCWGNVYYSYQISD